MRRKGDAAGNGIIVQNGTGAFSVTMPLSPPAARFASVRCASGTIEQYAFSIFLTPSRDLPTHPMSLKKACAVRMAKEQHHE